MENQSQIPSLEMKVLNLGKHKGFPMQFLCTPNKDGSRRITFADTEKHEDIGYEISTWAGKYKVESINEVRLSGNNYGVEEPVYFHDLKCTLIKPTELKKS